MKVVKILWIDSCNSNMNWTIVEDIECSPMFIETFGVVVKDADEFIAVAQNYGNDPEQYSNITTIPKGCIKEIFGLHEDIATESISQDNLEKENTELVEQKPVEENKHQGWIKNTNSTKPPKCHSILMHTTNGIAEGEWQGDKWLQYRWNTILKNCEILEWIELSKLLEQKPTEKQCQIDGAELQKSLDTIFEAIDKAKDEIKKSNYANALDTLCIQYPIIPISTQKQWKPSEEQMGALLYWTTQANSHALNSLYEQLKQLK